MLWFIGQVFPYLALAVFLVGMTWHILEWLKRPVPFPLTVHPVPGGTGDKIAIIGKELLLFDSLRRGDKGLWLWSWLMHVALLSVIGGHIVGISQLGQQFVQLGFTPEQSLHMSAVLGTTSGLVLFVSLVVLFYRRTAVPEVRRMSAPAEYFDLLLILAVVISGMHMRLTSIEANLPAIRDYMAGLLTFQPVAMPHEWIFVSHFFLVNMLLLYFPFSKLVHFAGFFVTRSLVAAVPSVYPNTTQTGQSVLYSEGRALSK